MSVTSPPQPAKEVPILVVRGGRARVSLDSLRENWEFREVFRSFIIRRVKVRYKQASVGIGWAVLQPVLAAAIFAVFFGHLAKVPSDGVPYLLFALAGTVVWSYFSSSASLAMESLVIDQGLLKKVYFPREILPLATVGVALFDFVLQSLVFIAYMIVSRYGFQLDVLWLYPIAFVALLTVTVAVTFWVSALNVRYRDVQHLIGLALLVWFWVTPIVYAAGDVYKHIVTLPHGTLLWRVFLLNPLTWIVFGFQRALYHSSDAAVKLAPYTAGQLAIGLACVTAVGLAVLYLTWRVFFSMSGDFAEEL
jgi:ABC-type polysaccharide/polyol phosphate export permease